MENPDATEAVQIVDSFVKAYMAIEASRETTGGDRRITILESERKVRADQLQRQRQAIRQMAEEYGSVALTSRQEMMLQRVADLQTELTKTQTRKITLETQKQLLDQTSQQRTSPGEMFKMRYEFINANPTFQVLSSNITQLEQGLVAARQELAHTNPALKRKAELLETLKTRLEEKRNELGKTFDKLIAQELTKDHKGQLADVTIELTQIADYEERLQDMLARENTETIELGRKQLAIQEQQEQLDLTKELYDRVRRQLQQLEMERKRTARISIAYSASAAPIPNRRIKLIAALMFGSLAAGCFLALLISKADRSFYAPDDVTRRLGVPIIGTTADPSYIDAPELPQQICCDYQTICANLGLLNGNGIPKKLVVTSPGIGDGKTTFSINFATSLAKAGKKVLLIDGDLRKPDIQRMLNLPNNSRGLQEVLWDNAFERAVQSFAAGFDVLTADSRNTTDASVLLSKQHVGKCLDTISQEYDHVIIDTPPVLAFPDALLWAKMGDGVILASFSGRTTEPDLRKTLKRLEQVKVKVLGTIFHNVRNNYSYNRYAYGYYMQQAARKNYRNNHKKDTKTMLMMPIKEFSKDRKSSESSQKISD
jgi:capsular exopolysaccharide synthesis family protein